MAATAIANRLGILRPVISSHLKVLAQAGLVRGERTDRFIAYHLLGERITEVGRLPRDISGEQRFAWTPRASATGHPKPLGFLHFI